MKKTLIILSMLLIAVQGYSQVRTSEDVKADIKFIVGAKSMVISENISNLLKEYTTLKVREYRNLPQKQLIVDSIDEFCFTCQCPRGHIYLQGSGDCGMNNFGCGRCFRDGLQMQAYIQSCAGSPCGNIIGAQ
jgi:hypothetical protein